MNALLKTRQRQSEFDLNDRLATDGLGVYFASLEMGAERDCAFRKERGMKPDECFAILERCAAKGERCPVNRPQGSGRATHIVNGTRCSDAKLLWMARQ